MKVVGLSLTACFPKSTESGDLNAKIELESPRSLSVLPCAALVSGVEKLLPGDWKTVCLFVKLRWRKSGGAVDLMLFCGANPNPLESMISCAPKFENVLLGRRLEIVPHEILGMTKINA